MLRIILFFVGLILVQVAYVARAFGEEPDYVGEYGDFSKLAIQGSSSFSVPMIRRKLSRDPVAILAGHPLAPLSKLPHAVSTQIQSGYAGDGFADARVHTEIDVENNRLLAIVTEGNQYRNGSVIVQNAKQINTDLLRKRLVEHSPPKSAVVPIFDVATGLVSTWLDKDGKEVELDDPVWVEGKPSHTGPFAEEIYRRKLAHALQDLGFRHAKFHVTLALDDVKHLVNLVVRFEDEGTPAIVSRVTVSGNRRDSTESILDYLKLPIGTVLTRQRETQLQYDIWRSGRYTKAKIELRKPFLWQSGEMLALTLTEAVHSPKLDQTLSREEETLLKMSRWLAQERSSDLVVSVSHKDIRIKGIFGVRDGVAVAVRPASTRPDQATVFLASHHELSCYPSGAGVYLSAVDPPSCFPIKLSLTATGPESADRPINIGFGFGVTGYTAGVSPEPLQIQMNPAYCLAQAHIRNAKTSWQGDILLVRSDRDSFEIDSRDGRLIRYSMNDDGFRGVFEFEAGAYERARQAAHEMREGRQNKYSAQSPWRTTLEFLMHEDVVDAWAAFAQGKPGIEMTAKRKAEMRVWTKLVLMGVVDPLDAAYQADKSAEESGDGREFVIPVPYSGEPKTKDYALAAIPWADAMFPRNSWPWTVWRDSCLVMAGEGELPGRQLSKMYLDDDYGPLSALVIAKLLQSVKNHPAAEAIASHGQKDKSVDRFCRDIAPLLDDTKVSGKCVRRLCEILMQMDASELAAMQTWFPPNVGQAFDVFATELGKHRHQPLEDNIQQALAKAWEAELRAIVSQQLLELATSSKMTSFPNVR